MGNLLGWRFFLGVFLGIFIAVFLFSWINRVNAVSPSPGAPETIGESPETLDEFPVETLNAPIDTTPILPEGLVHEKLGPHRGSKREEICRKILEELTGKSFPPCRPDFLRNPETGRNLELDCYNPEIQVALEFNGKQHYVWPNFTGQSREDFIKQVRRDIYRVQACDNNGVYLITVPYNVKDGQLRPYIKYYLEQARVL